MSVTAPPTVKAPKPPKDVSERLDRGRKRNGELTGKRNEAWNFWRGDQYCYVANAGYVVQQSTITAVDGEGKPRHRMRLVRNELLDSTEHEVAAATSRIPSYQVNPSTIDPADISAAHLSEKIARYGYDAWRLREVREQIVTSAIVAGEGFGWPYWDETIGPLVDPETGACEGEVAVRLFTANEVYWEPGVRFDASRWHAIDQARPLDEVKALPNFIGGALSADATTGETINQRAKPQVDQLVMVTEYLERPSATWPKGRRLTMANGKVILPPETYPCVDGTGEPVDEPVLHKLSRIIDPDSDRDMGLVRHGLDAQRTINDCVSKESEWKNLALNPQILAPVGALVRRLTDEPGAVVEYRPIGGVAPQWRPVPPIPGELQRMREEAAAYIRRLFAQNDIPSQVSAARAIQAVIERDENRRSAFVARLADFDSRLMRHCCSGDTIVRTADGLRHARDLAGTTAETLTADGQFRPAEWRSYGHRPLWRVEFEDGEIGHYTDQHQWVVQCHRRGDGQERVATTDLAGRRVPLATATALGVEDGEEWEEGVRNGLMYGDGHRATNTYKPTGRKYSFSRMKQYGPEMCAIAERFFRCAERKSSPSLGVAVATKCYPPDLKALPGSDHTRDYLLGFLAGALAADGHVNGAPELSSASKADLYSIATLAHRLGIATRPIRGRERREGAFAPGWDWTLRFAKDSFMDATGVVDRSLILKDSHAATLRASGLPRARYKQVVGVTSTDRVEEVFCCEEPVTHTWVAGSGYVTSNCLYLVQRYYTERRLVKIRGRFGWESIPDFKGTDLRGQADVVVMPASIEPRTKESISQTVMNYAQLGWVDRNEAMFAIENGTAESLIEDYELDVAKANRQIRRIEALGAGLPGGDVPIADPEFDNPAVMIHVLSQFAKTPEFEQMPPPAQEATKLLVQQYRQIQADRDQQAAQQQALQAAQMGQGNASRPPANGSKPLPSLPSVQSPPQGSQ